MTKRITQYKITGSDADVSGDAVDTSEFVARGKIIAIRIDYSASSDAGTDVVITDEYGQTFLTRNNSKTDGWFYPRTVAQDASAATVTYDGTNEIYTEFVVFSRITSTVADNAAGETVDVYVYVEEY